MRISDWSSDVCSSDLNKVRTRPVTWIYVDGRGRDLQTLVTDIQAVIAREVKLPPGVSVSYTGQFEFLVRATERMKIVVPVTLAIIFGLLYLTFRRFDRSEEHTSELQSLMRISYAVFCLTKNNNTTSAQQCINT